MAAESSASAATTHSGDGKPVLITCPECHLHKVVQCRSKQPWSKDKIFYTCPDHQKDGSGCPFFLWEAGYIKHLEAEAAKAQAAKEKAVAREGAEITEPLLEHNLDLGNGDGTAVQGELRTLIKIGYDIAGFLKCIVCMCLVIVAVQLLLVLLHFKNGMMNVQ